jgi:hypothetical protein
MFGSSCVRNEKEALALHRLGTLNLDRCIAAVLRSVGKKKCRPVFGLQVNDEII